MSKDYKTIWNNCLRIIRDALQNEQVYNTWFLPIVPVQLEDNVLTLQVPSPFFYEWLEEHYIDILKKTIRRELGPGGMLRYSVVVEQSIEGNPYKTLLPSSGRKAIHNMPKDMAHLTDINIHLYHG